MIFAYQRGSECDRVRARATRTRRALVVYVLRPGLERPWSGHEYRRTTGVGEKWFEDNPYSAGDIGDFPHDRLESGRLLRLLLVKQGDLFTKLSRVRHGCQTLFNYFWTPVDSWTQHSTRANLIRINSTAPDRAPILYCSISVERTWNEPTAYFWMGQWSLIRKITNAPRASRRNREPRKHREPCLLACRDRDDSWEIKTTGDEVDEVRWRGFSRNFVRDQGRGHEVKSN